MYSLTGFFRKNSPSSPAASSNNPSSPTPSVTSLATMSSLPSSLVEMLSSLDKDPERLVSNLNLLLTGEMEEIDHDDYKSVSLIVDHIRNIIVAGVIGIPLPSPGPLETHKSLQLQHKNHYMRALQVCESACQAIYRSSLLLALSDGEVLSRFEFESRQQVVTIVNCLIRRKTAGILPTLVWLSEKDADGSSSSSSSSSNSNRSVSFLSNLISSYSKGTDVSLSAGLMLREALRMESLTVVLLENNVLFEKLLSYLDCDSFDISSDAFATTKECLTRHRAVVARFLERNYTFFMNIFLPLLESSNYITKRQSLKLLGELLLDRCNFETMTVFIGKGKNLKQIMKLLKDDSKTVQSEAWHIFKIFIANPSKTPSVEGILQRNKERLLTFLSTFYPFKEPSNTTIMKESDNLLRRQFIEERIFLIGEIQKINQPSITD